MDINGAFPSKYLKAADLGAVHPTVIIDRVEVEEVGDGDLKPVLYFRGKDKGLVMNKTNANTIIEILGTSETDGWHGHRIRLFATKTEFQGKRVPCIRVEEAPGAVPVPPPKPSPEPAFEASDSDVPF